MRLFLIHFGRFERTNQTYLHAFTKPRWTLAMQLWRWAMDRKMTLAMEIIGALTICGGFVAQCHTGNGLVLVACGAILLGLAFAGAFQ